MQAKTDYIAGDFVDADDVNQTAKNANDAGGFRDDLNAGETINGATLPVGVYQDSSDGELYSCDADDIKKLNFIGFAISNSTDGNPIELQTGGVVRGFSGLTEGESYYIQNDGTLAINYGPYKLLAGIAVSATELLIVKQEKTYFDRAMKGEQGYLVSLGEDWEPESLGGSGTTSQNRKEATVSGNSGTSDDEGRITGDGVRRGDTSSSQPITFDEYMEFETYTENGEIDQSGAGAGLEIYKFIGFSSSDHFQDPDDENNTEKHIGFYIVRANAGGNTWTLYSSSADGTTQTTNLIAGYTDARTAATFRIEYDGDEARFYLDGVLEQTHTTNLPTGDALENRHGVFVWSYQGGNGQFGSCKIEKQRSYWLGKLA